LAGSTFITLTNKVLKHFNEVQLSVSNFTNATAFQDFAKDSVNDAIRHIEQSEREWPWSWNETTQALTGTVAEYAFPTTTLDSVEHIDWHSFILKRDDTLDPKVSERKLKYIPWDTYLEKYMERDANIETGNTSVREPDYITWKQETETWLVTPTPDRAYNVYFEWWSYRDDLSASTDTTRIPSRYNHVIDSFAKSYCYDFRGDAQRSNTYRQKGESGLRTMRENLINRHDKLRDNRVHNRTG